MILEYFILFVLLALAIAFMVAVVCMPIMIAGARGLNSSKRSWIMILSILGIFCGVTWFIALILSMIWSADNEQMLNNLDNLEKLAKLYKDKVITKSEYDAMKAKMLGK